MNDVIEKSEMRCEICIERKELSVARREGDGSDAVRYSALGCASLSEQKCNRRSNTQRPNAYQWIDKWLESTYVSFMLVAATVRALLPSSISVIISS